MLAQKKTSNNKAFSSSAAARCTRWPRCRPSYLHGRRLLTLADTIEFLNLVLGKQLTAEEKTALEAFVRVL